MSIKFANFTKELPKSELKEGKKIQTADDRINRLNKIKKMNMKKFKKDELSEWFQGNLQTKGYLKLGHARDMDISVYGNSPKGNSIKVPGSDCYVDREFLNEGVLSSFFIAKKSRNMDLEVERTHKDDIDVNLNIINKQGFKDEMSKDWSLNDDEVFKDVAISDQGLCETGIKEIPYKEYEEIPPLHVIDNYTRAVNMGVFDEINVLDTYSEGIKEAEIDIKPIEDPILVGKHCLAKDIYFIIDAWYENIAADKFLEKKNKKLYQEGVEENKNLSDSTQQEHIENKNL